MIAVHWIRRARLTLLGVLLAMFPFAGRAQAQTLRLGVDETVDSEETDAGYCQFVRGVAASQRAVALAPELFGSFGYVDQQSGVLDVPDRDTERALRLTAGLGYRLSGIARGMALSRRANADCRRQRALSEVRRYGQTAETTATRAALAARARVLEAALPEGRAMLSRAQTQFEQRNVAAPELLANRLRLNELQAEAERTRREMAALPEPSAPSSPLGTALRAFYSADADLEREEASLRSADSWDIRLRVGYDRFIEDDNRVPVFGVVSLSYNLGGLFQPGAHRKARLGRAQYVRREGRRLGVEVGEEGRRLQRLAEASEQRQKQTAALRADLEQQLVSLDNMEGEAAARFRQTLWFELVQVKAEDEYLRTFVATAKALSQSSSSQ